MKRLFILLALFSALAKADIISVGISDEHIAALNINNGQFTGTIAKPYQCVFNLLNHTFDFRVLPQKRSLYELEKGTLDMALPLVKYSSRDRYAYFADTLLKVPFYLFTKSEKTFKDDLSNLTFVLIRSSAGTMFVRDEGAQYIEVSDWNQAFNLIKVNRFDATILPGPLVSTLHSDSLKGLKKSVAGYLHTSLYISKKSKNATELLNQVNQAISQCTQT